MKRIRDVPDLVGGGLRILIVSPQSWDGMHVSKHHYAQELAMQGNRVYFLNPPSVDVRRGAVRLRESGIPNLTVVDYRLHIGYRLKFKCRHVFNELMNRRARAIACACGSDLDVVWDFDNTYNFTSLPAFGAKYSIFHAMDQLVAGQRSSKNADCVLAVADSILANIEEGSGIKRGLIGHGLSRQYVEFAQRQLIEYTRPTAPLRIGYVGNLDAAAIDGEMIAGVVLEYPQLHFDFFGPFGRDVTQRPAWQRRLQAKSNTTFHGLTSNREILTAAESIHGWMLCYDSKRDINNAANSHKVLEYLATGSPIASTYLDAYGNSSLLHMATDKTNASFGSCFREMLLEIQSIKRPEIERRLNYALERSYVNRLQRVAQFVKEVGGLLRSPI